jgi:hypothetical protein
MATGVVSIACHFMGLRPVALALIGLNWVAWPVLWVLTIVRALRFRAELLRDISDHQRAPGFFTIVAGTCVLGTQNVVVIGATGVGTVLWWLGLILWFVIMYTFFTAVTVRARKPTLKRGINAAWLIAAVSTQSVVVLRGVIDINAPPPDAVEFQVIAMFLIVCMLYLAIIPLIFYRLTFVPMSREDFSPPYWINIGAVAITALAGSVLILRGETWPLLGPLLPFLKGSVDTCNRGACTTHPGGVASASLRLSRVSAIHRTRPLLDQEIASSILSSPQKTSPSMTKVGDPKMPRVIAARVCSASAAAAASAEARTIVSSGFCLATRSERDRFGSAPATNPSSNQSR